MICQQFRELIADYLAEEIEAIDLSSGGVANEAA